MQKETKMRSSTERSTTYPLSRHVMRVAFTGLVNAIVSIKLCKTKLLDEALSHHFQGSEQTLGLSKDSCTFGDSIGQLMRRNCEWLEC